MSHAKDMISGHLRSARKAKRQEFARLRSVLPSISTRSDVARIDVLEEAIKYIAHLQAALENHTTTLSTEEIQQRFRETSQTRNIIRNCSRHRQCRVANVHKKLASAPKPRNMKVPKQKQEKQSEETSSGSDNVTRSQQQR